MAFDPVMQDLNRHLAGQAADEAFDARVVDHVEHDLDNREIVAETIDDILGTADFVPQTDYTTAADEMAAVLQAPDAEFAQAAAAFFTQLRRRVRERLDEQVRQLLQSERNADADGDIDEGGDDE